MKIFLLLHEHIYLDALPSTIIKELSSSLTPNLSESFSIIKKMAFSSYLYPPFRER